MYIFPENRRFAKVWPWKSPIRAETVKPPFWQGLNVNLEANAICWWFGLFWMVNPRFVESMRIWLKRSYVPPRNGGKLFGTWWFANGLNGASNIFRRANINMGMHQYPQIQSLAGQTSIHPVYFEVSYRGVDTSSDMSVNPGWILFLHVWICCYIGITMIICICKYVYIYIHIYIYIFMYIHRWTDR